MVSFIVPLLLDPFWRKRFADRLKKYLIYDFLSHFLHRPGLGNIEVLFERREFLIFALPQNCDSSDNDCSNCE